ncbi:hypothetical protein M408DRAFT_27966 [Serendipita vermifera MAFF 305830]|uniref:Uncharacterized protein n=1 Tax=Serendipita vermifera MAFF 305830 TaxID=933852 RepID=A0A0C2WAD2_SERVB|nr:hypothetical protein M408DRAFT_27966 [Serendipita vermifera MAFF 305830]
MEHIKYQSNLPPSAEEAEVLKALLQQKTKERSVIDKKISQAQDDIASATQALDLLTRSSARLYSILKANQIASNTRSQSARLYTSSQELHATELSVALIKECESICLLTTDTATPLGEEVKSSLNTAFGRLEVLMASVEHALRQQRLIVNVKSSSIQLYSIDKLPVQTIIDKVLERFSVIKRVPDEVWYEILTVRISKASHSWPRSDTLISIPALPYTHVCRSWRRVINSSPSMWRAIHWSMNCTKEPNRNLIDLWISRSPEHERRIYERQSYFGQVPAGLSHMQFQLPIHEKLQYYLYQTRKELPAGQDRDYSSPINFPSLSLESSSSSSSSRVRSVQESVIHRFPLLESLHLQDIIPRNKICLPSTLTHLGIGFRVPHGTYRLSDLLTPTLESIQLTHFIDSGTPTLDEKIRLPKLRTMDITPLEYETIKKLNLPSLEKLIIRAPLNKAATFPTGWVESLFPHCANVANLELIWPSILQSDPVLSLDRLQVFFELRLHTPKLATVEFSSGRIDGNALADFLGTDQRGRLEHLVIDECIGVSRMDCERFVQYVGKLSVYRTVHKATIAEESE